MYLIRPAIYLGVALGVLASCAGCDPAGAKKIILEPELGKLTKARVEATKATSGGVVIVMSDEQSEAVLTVKLAKGKYDVRLYGIAFDSETDAVYLTLNENEYRIYTHDYGKIVPFDDIAEGDGDSIQVVIGEAEAEMKVTLKTAEVGVKVDRIEITPATE